MGNKQLKGYKAPTFKKQNWSEIKHTKRPLKSEHGGYINYINNLTSEQLQQHLVIFQNSIQFQRYLDFFSWREREQSIVNGKYMNYEQNNEYCTTSYQAKVYIEHIPVRLSDIQDIPFPQNLYLILNSLIGFQKLYQIVGYFKITEDLICVDKNGQVKVWLNSDLSKCEISNLNSSEEMNECRSQYYESKMVDEIITIIQQNTTQIQEITISLTNYLRYTQKLKLLNFKIAKEMVRKYAFSQNVDIPNYFESVIGIFDDLPSQNGYISQEQQSPHFHSTEQRRSYHPQSFGHRPITQIHYSKQHPQEIHNYDYLNRIPSRQQTINRGSTNSQQITFNPIYIERKEIKSNNSNHEFFTPYPIINNNINLSHNFKVKFNYQNQLAEPSKNVYQPIKNIMIERQSSLTQVKPATLNQMTAEANSFKESFSNKRLTYHDASNAYQLDKQLIEDMIKYLIIF